MSEKKSAFSTGSGLWQLREISKHHSKNWQLNSTFIHPKIVHLREFGSLMSVFARKSF